MSSSFNYSSAQLTTLVLLRIFIGWHLLYEGLIKLLNPLWSSESYLNDSQGIFSSLFKALVSNESVLQIVDFMNIWLLVIIGLCLILGLFDRILSLAGAVLLLLYYLCQPPVTGFEYILPSEGNYLLINKTLIEAAALLVLFYFPTGKLAGVEYFIKLNNRN